MIETMLLYFISKETIIERARFDQSHALLILFSPSGHVFVRRLGEINSN
jgi:hypothetical protein